MTIDRQAFSRIVAVVCAVLGTCAVARAQSAVDGFDPGANSYVQTVAVQPDGKILVGGWFTTLGGGGIGTTPRHRIGRLNADGSLDTSFNPGVNGTVVHALAVQPDGKILVGGMFSGLGGGSGITPRKNIGRLNADGSLDASFNPGANGVVGSLIVQTDGRILVGGGFTGLGGETGATPRKGIGRLNADGSLDPTFNPGASPYSIATSGSVLTMALQPDAKILVGGSFLMLGGGPDATSGPNIGRLNADGSIDSAFNPGAPASTMIRTIALQPDGKILIGGCFTALMVSGCANVHRLNADGALDTSFDPGVFGFINTLAVQADGKILVAGHFPRLGGGGMGTTPRYHIGRLNADGSLDASFDAGATGMMVNALAVRADGTILVAGNFSMLGGGGTGTTPRRNIGLLTNTDAATQRLTVTGGGSVVTWARSGAGPEVSRATLELSTDGATYTPLESVTQVSGGWQATGQSLAANQNLFLRARGYYATGYGNASGSIVESVQTVYLTPPTISNLPHTHTRIDTPITVSFTVGDVESGASAVTVSASSSNTTPVPAANLVLGGTGAGRTLTITPAPHQTGATRITLTASVGSLTTTTSFVLAVYGHVAGDFDGHGKADLTVFRPSNGTWYVRHSGTNHQTATQWGNGLDQPVPGDYDGDGMTDIAVFRPSNGTWYIVFSSTGSAAGVQWGNASDVPVPGDYDGDGKTDVAVFRPSNGIWYLWYSGTGTPAGVEWGNRLDRPVPGDYDGDGKTDAAVFRPSDGIWYLRYSSTGTGAGFHWGNANDVTVPGDYDGDGKTDVAVFRPSTGAWHLRYSGTGTTAGFLWGNRFDVPVPGDYDGDGRTDIAVFRPSNGTWYLWHSSTGTGAGFQWGNGQDVPILKRP